MRCEMEPLRRIAILNGIFYFLSFTFLTMDGLLLTRATLKTEDALTRKRYLPSFSFSWSRARAANRRCSLAA